MTSSWKFGRPWLALSALTLFITLLFPSTAAFADTDSAFNLTVSPLPTSLVTTPGQSISTPIKVENTGDKTAKVSVSLMKFSAMGATGEPVLQAPSVNDQFIKWASFSQTSFQAVPGVYNTITLTIKPPKTAAFGYYYAVVFSENNAANTPSAPKQNKVNGAVASLVLLDVQAPGEKRQLEVVHFQASHKLYQYLPATFTVTVHNTGNIHVVPSGDIFVGRKADGNFIDTLPINEGQGNVLPHSNRIFTVKWGDGFPNYTQKTQNGQVIVDKSGTPEEKLSWNLANADKIRFGRYVASLTLVYNDGQHDIPLSGQVVFWVIPWLPILIVLVIVVLMILGLVVFFRAVLRRFRGVKKDAHPSP